MSSEIGIEGLRTILGALPDLVVLVGLDRRIRYLNRAAEGYEPYDLIGRDFIDLVEPSFREAQAEMFDKVLGSGEPTTDEIQVLGANGDPEWHEGSMIPLIRDGNVVDIVIVTKNVTARRLAEEEATALRALVPVCSWCRRVRDDQGYWQGIESYIAEQSGSLVTHAMCPDCEEEMGPPARSSDAV
ncbi:MAG: PAS domain-containing protein [Gemmatimonadota bacterium]